MEVRREDIVAEATPRRRRTAQARSAAVAGTLGHVGAQAALMAVAAPTAVAVRTVEAAATVVIVNSCTESAPPLRRGFFVLSDCRARDESNSTRASPRPPKRTRAFGMTSLQLQN